MQTYKIDLIVKNLYYREAYLQGNHMKFIIKKPILMTSILILSYSFIWVLITGNAGFTSDEWRMIGISYWYNFPAGIEEYLIVSGRPLQLFHHLVLFEMVGFIDSFSNMLNILIHMMSVVFFGIALWHVQPSNHILPTTAMLLAFFVPVLTSTLHQVQFSGSYVGMLFYWLSVVLIQRGILTEFRLYWVLSSLALTASFYGYENAIALAPVTAILALAVFLRIREVTFRSFTKLCIKLGFTIATPYILFLLPRYLLNYNLHVSSRTDVTLDSILKYTTILPNYLAIPTEIQGVSYFTIGIMVLLGAIIFTLLIYTIRYLSSDTIDKFYLFIGSLVTIGMMLIILGSIPFILAGYGASVNYGGGGRVFSSAIYGLIIIIAAIFTLVVKFKSLQLFFCASLTLWITLWVGYHLELSMQARSIEATRQIIYKNLLTVVPEVESNTSLLLIDFQTNEGQQPILGGTIGTQRMIEILYDDLTVQGYFVYTGIDPETATEYRSMIISNQGVSARGRTNEPPISHDQIIILQLDGTNVILVEELSANDRNITALWYDDIQSITTNNSLIDITDTSNVERLQEIGILD